MTFAWSDRLERARWQVSQLTGQALAATGQKPCSAAEAQLPIVVSPWRAAVAAIVASAASKQRVELVAPSMGGSWEWPPLDGSCTTTSCERAPRRVQMLRNASVILSHASVIGSHAKKIVIITVTSVSVVVHLQQPDAV